MKTFFLGILILVQLCSVRSQDVIIRQISKVSTFLKGDSLEDKTREVLLLKCNKFISQFFPQNKTPVYIILKSSSDTSIFNIFYDNIYGNSLDDDNKKRRKWNKYYQPGIRIVSNKDIQTILKLTEYALQNKNKFKLKWANLKESNSYEKEKLGLQEDEVKALMRSSLSARVTTFLSK